MVFLANTSGIRGFRTERLLRAVKLSVAEYLAEPALLGRAPRKPANRRARDAAAAMRRANPTITLQEVARQPQAIWKFRLLAGA